MLSNREIGARNEQQLTHIERVFGRDLAMFKHMKDDHTLEIRTEVLITRERHGEKAYLCHVDSLGKVHAHGTDLDLHTVSRMYTSDLLVKVGEFRFGDIECRKFRPNEQVEYGSSLLMSKVMFKKHTKV